MVEKEDFAHLPVIEVPPELRGLSDEDILILSESREKKARPRGNRPSKKERALRRQEISRQRLLEVEKQIEEEHQGITSRCYMKQKPMPKLSDYDTTNSGISSLKEETSSKKYASLADLFKKEVVFEREEKKPNVVVRSSISSSPKPSSGRVLQAKFSFPGAKKIETTIVNAKDLEEKRAAEREKKIKKTTSVSETKVSANGEVVKRPRGRPRKVQISE